MKKTVLFLFILMLLFVAPGCEDDSGLGEDGDTAGTESDGDSESTDCDNETAEEASDCDTEAEEAELDAENDGDAAEAEAADSESMLENEEEADGGLPDSLPFEFTRPDVGEPPTEEEIAEFTRKVTGFWKEAAYFNWLWWNSHGLDKSYDANMLDYKEYWQDTSATKSGDTVTFSHFGGADNITLRVSRILMGAASGYLSTGDEMFGRIVEQYAKGILANFYGMTYGDNDPNPYIMARAIFTHNHGYEMEGGRKVYVDYDPVKVEKYDWNAHTIPNANCPYYGSIWQRNMRSKDDVPHLYRAAPLLRRVALEGKDESVREACRTAYEYIQGFARDIVDSGYYIRTKDKEGNAYIPMEEEGGSVVKDLASFVNYESLIPNAECNAKYTSAILAYGDPRENDCGQGFGGAYEGLAGAGNYFNWAIIRYFHLAALLNSLEMGYNEVAQSLLEGVAIRADDIVHDTESQSDYERWNGDVATFLLSAASTGLPLTSEEARIVQERMGAAADAYKTWPYWDLWADSVADGEVPMKPDENADHFFIRPEEMGYLLYYCYSQYRNPAGVAFVDCDIVNDPARWGE